MEEKTTAYLLAVFLLVLDAPSLVWVLLPGVNGDAESVKIICVVFVGGVVNLVVGLAGWKKLNLARHEWGGYDALLCRFFQLITLWGIGTFGLTYLKQWVFPLA